MNSIAIKELTYYAPSTGSEREFQILRKRREIEEWCNDNFKQYSWEIIHYYDNDGNSCPTFFFHNVEDYMLFCMRWL